MTGGSVRGRLSISASIPFGSMYVAPAIPTFFERHPDVRIDLSLTDDVIDLLGSRVDIAIRMGSLPDSTLVARKLGQSRRVVCASPSYLDRKGVPTTPADLQQHDCLGFNFRRTSAPWPFVRDGRELVQPISAGLLVNNGETLKQLTLAGCGIARLGRFHVEKELKDGTLVPLLEKHNPGDVELIHAVYIGGGHLPHRVRAFIDHLVSALSKSSLTRTPAKNLR
jgi:DNA-binding transcriptional LysR family regulator